MESTALQELVVFFSNGSVGPQIRQAIEALSIYRARVATIMLFSWLKCRARTMSDKPLDLSKGFEWCHNLRFLVEQVETLRCIFLVDNDTLDFRDEISDAQRKEIVQFIDNAMRIGQD